MNKKKLIRVTTSDISLDSLIKGQLKFLSSEFEVVGVSNNTGVLEMVGKRERIRTIEVPMRREISLLSDFKCLWILYRLFKKEKPEIVHANTPKGSMLSMIAAKLAHVPHRFYTVTGLRYQGTTGKFRTLLMIMERISCYCATKIIPEGQGVKKALFEDKITSKNMYVIHNGNINGIDTTYFSPEATIKQIKNTLHLPEHTTADEARAAIRKEIGLKENDFAFIFIGRIVSDKGMHELAEATKQLIAIHNNCKIILVGNFESDLDPLKPEDELFYNQNDSVHFVGYQADVRPYLFAADALAFPSYREGFPNVVMQAGAMGLASIVTNINGCNEIIIEEENGIIIPTKNVQALYAAMKDFIEQPQKKATIAAKAREMIKSRYEQNDVWQAMLQEYKNELTKK